MKDLMGRSLRYLDAARIGNAGIDHEASVETGNGSLVGRLLGFIVDPQGRRLRYVVVDSGRGGSRALPFGPACFDFEQRRLRMLDDPGAEQCPEFDSVDFPAFSDDDLIAALFSPSKDAAA